MGWADAMNHAAGFSRIRVESTIGFILHSAHTQTHTEGHWRVSNESGRMASAMDAVRMRFIPTGHSGSTN